MRQTSLAGWAKKRAAAPPPPPEEEDARMDSGGETEEDEPEALREEEDAEGAGRVWLEGPGGAAELRYRRCEKAVTVTRLEVAAGRPDGTDGRLLERARELAARDGFAFDVADDAVPPAGAAGAAAAAALPAGVAVRHLRNREEFAAVDTGGGDGDARATLRYARPAPGVLEVRTLHVPRAMRGRGVAALLSRATFEYAAGCGLRVRAGDVSYVTGPFLDANPALRRQMEGGGGGGSGGMMARTESVVAASAAGPAGAGGGGGGSNGDDDDDDEKDEDRPGTARLPHAYVKTWSRVRAALTSRRVRDADELADLLADVGRSPDARTARRGLRALVKALTPAERATLFTRTLPFVQRRAVAVEAEFPAAQTGCRVSLLEAGRDTTVELRRSQVLALMACSFFSLHSDRGRGSFNCPNMGRLFSRVGQRPSQAHKVRCVLRYFEAMRAREEAGGAAAWAGTVCYARRAVPRAEADALVESLGEAGGTAGGAASREAAAQRLVPFETRRGGTIEDHAGALQMDFANRYIGGGVLGLGCVQEEIRFVINPECLVSLLLCPVMGDLEAVAIVGAERFSNYDGYAWSFADAGPHRDATPRDSAGRVATAILAADALYLGGGRRDPARQYDEPALRRELVKAYAALSFQNPRPAAAALASHHYTAVATGNWGCGAFGGHVVVKAMLQWIAASLCGGGEAAARLPVTYYTFGDAEAEPLEGLVAALAARGTTAGWLWRALLEYAGVVPGPDHCMDGGDDDLEYPSSAHLARYLAARAEAG